MELINKASEFLSANMGSILSFVGILWGVVKAVSNSKAGPVVAKLQAGVDAVAKAIEGLGKLLGLVSNILAEIIKSDGFLGRK